jgi:branched-chain amino acid transport system permease protein
VIGFLQNLIDALSLGSLYALAALGIGLLFGILRLANFAHGDFITVGAYALIVPSLDVTAKMFIGHWPLILMVPTVCIIVVVLALFADALLFRPMRRASAPTLMIASFALGYIIQNVILMFYGARPKAADLWSNLSQQVEIGQLRVPQLQLVTIAVTIILMAEDFRMARYLGVRANFVVGLAFALSGLLAAAVSLLFLSQTGQLSNTMGVPLMLFAFIATVIGGMGSLTGAVVGGFTVGLISTMLQAYLPPELRPFRDAFVFAVVILILLYRPGGLVPTKALVQRV